jgi:hypothetical protein
MVHNAGTSLADYWLIVNNAIERMAGGYLRGVTSSTTLGQLFPPSIFFNT